MTRPHAEQLALVATDFDGTLLGHDREISGRTRETLERLAESHLDFVVITGRPPRFCERVLEQTGIPTRLICANGAVGYDPLSGDVTQFATLDLDVAFSVLDDLRRGLPDAGFCAELGDEFAADHRWFEVAGREPRDAIDDLRDYLDHRVHKLLVALPDHTPDEALVRIQEITGERANPTHAGLAFIELMPPGVDKAFGLRRLCADSGVRPDQVIAFGDMPNDVAMLEWAGWGVAVGNAHDTAKAAADEVTETNIDDGVAIVLDALLERVAD